MNADTYYYNCSPGYIGSIATDLHIQVLETIEVLPKRASRSEINFDLFWLLTSMGWSYEAAPSGIDGYPDPCLGLDCQLEDLKPNNQRSLCLTAETIDHHRYADFGMQFDSGIVQLEVQFGKMENLLMDFCGFRMAYAEKRLALGIAMVLVDPGGYFSRPDEDFKDMARFDAAKDALNAIGLDCPIWLVGIEL